MRPRCQKCNGFQRAQSVNQRLRRPFCSAVSVAASLCAGISPGGSAGVKALVGGHAHAARLKPCPDTRRSWRAGACSRFVRGRASPCSGKAAASRRTPKRASADVSVCETPRGFRRSRAKAAGDEESRSESSSYVCHSERSEESRSESCRVIGGRCIRARLQPGRRAGPKKYFSPPQRHG
jgi:hypothetical protein